MMSGDEIFGDEITSPEDPEAFERERSRAFWAVDEDAEDDFAQAEDRAVDEEGANEVREGWERREGRR